MAREMRHTTFQQLIDDGLLEIGDGYRAQNSELGSGTGPIFLRAGHITDSHIDFAGVEYFHEYLAPKVRSKMSQVGDTIITTKGNSTGRTSFVTARLPPFVYSPHLSYWRSRAPETLCGGFLRYWSQSVEFVDQLSGMKASTDMAPYLSLTDQRRLSITLPPYAEQKAMATVLGALDDKIELNRRMNATLEAMARALFQSWFVDFDPVRAKLDGRRPAGLDAATAALFPTAFQDSPLGLIPNGWAATTLGEACGRGGGNIQTGPFGTQLHAADYVPEGIPSIMPSDLRDNRVDSSSIARIREQDAKRLSVYRVQTGDVVYSRRGDVERRSLIRGAENGWLCGTGCLRVRFGSRGLNPHFGAACLGTSESRAWVVRHAVGATMPNLNTSILGALPIIVPPVALQSRFAEITGPWDELGTIALEQSRTLANLRDTLLPQLLNRQVGERIWERQ